MTFPNPLLSVHTSPAFQVGVEILFGALALVTLAYCIVVARRQHALWPLFVVIGASLNVPTPELNTPAPEARNVRPKNEVVSSVV